jgi:hypothetical protein
MFISISNLKAINTDNIAVVERYQRVEGEDSTPYVIDVEFINQYHRSFYFSTREEWEHVYNNIKNCN